MAKVSIKAKVALLRGSAIESKPVQVDGWNFDPDDEGYDGGAAFWEAVKCEECGTVLVMNSGGGGERHSDIDQDSECFGYVEVSSGPMMNYWYPVEIDDVVEAARAIADEPLCVVRVAGQTGLSLCGGGMDFSWEICRAFIAIGQLPPLHFVPPPAMAGPIRDAALVLAACAETVRVVRRRLIGSSRDLKRVKSDVLRRGRC